ncbi:MAG: hypothetical protein AAGH64_06510 [Planctomycetota bacterium]
MEFFSYDDIKVRFSDLLLSEESSGETVSLSLEIPEGGATRVVFGDGGDAGDTGDTGGGVRTIDRDREAIVPTVDGVLHRLHLNEIGVLPSGEWRGVLDLAAFELATDEAWNDFEAEAAMHMNGRDVLMFRSSEYSILRTIVKAMVENGDAPGHDLIMLSLDTPFLMRLAHTGGLVVWCANESIADEVAQVTGAHDE